MSLSSQQRQMLEERVFYNDDEGRTVYATPGGGTTTAPINQQNLYIAKPSKNSTAGGRQETEVEKGERKGREMAESLFGKKEEAKSRRDMMRKLLEQRATTGGSSAGASSRFNAAMRSARSSLGSSGLRGGARASALGGVAAQAQLSAQEDVEAQKERAQEELLKLSSQEMFAHSALPISYQAGPIAQENMRQQLAAANQDSGGILSALNPFKWF